jgi:deoxycytidine triphosphate deaminase
MKKVQEDTKVYFNGMSQTIIAGVEYKDDAAIVIANPSLFVAVESTKAPKKVAKKVEKKVEVVEEPKEELLVEAPVAALEVTEEVVETPEEVVTPKRKRSKK